MHVLTFVLTGFSSTDMEEYTGAEHGWYIGRLVK